MASSVMTVPSPVGLPLCASPAHNYTPNHHGTESAGPLALDPFRQSQVSLAQGARTLGDDLVLQNGKTQPRLAAGAKMIGSRVARSANSRCPQREEVNHAVSALRHPLDDEQRHSM